MERIHQNQAMTNIASSSSEQVEELLTKRIFLNQEVLELKFSIKSKAKVKSRCDVTGMLHFKNRSSRSQIFYKIRLLKHFSQFTWQHLCGSWVSLIKLQTLACNFIKKETPHSRFPVNFGKFVRPAFLHNTSGRLLLRKPVIDQIRFLEMLYQGNVWNLFKINKKQSRTKSMRLL